METIEVLFDIVSEEHSEKIIAALTLQGCESFWQEDSLLRAYFEKKTFKKQTLDETLNTYLTNDEVKYTINQLHAESWASNDQAEASDIIIANKLCISRNEKKSKKYPYHIIMNAASAFGAGDHPSTTLCIEMMLEMDFMNKKVLDLGTGTGILSALAIQMGASSVTAIDNNPWAINIANYTAKTNHLKNIRIFECELKDKNIQQQNYDIILANLNQMVFESEWMNIQRLVQKKDALLLLSGFMNKFSTQMHINLNISNLSIIKEKNESEWIGLLVKKT